MLHPIANMMRMRAPPPQRPSLVGPHMTGAQPHNSHSHSMPDMAADNMPGQHGQKSSATMDSQYMQQQSQIFVFTTRLANSAAEAVDNGSFASIVDFHCSNPETKKLLDKYPLKPQLNRSNSSAVWLNSLAQRQGPRPIKAMHPSGLKNSFGQGVRAQMANSCVGSCNMHSPSGPGPGGGMTGNWPHANNGNMCSNASPSPNWSPQSLPQSQPMFAQNFQSDDPNHKFINSSMPPNGAITRPCAPFGPNQLNNQTFANSCPTQMAGPEIPDENLTPQQKQHREKQLAIIRKMQLQLCPEMMDSPPMAPPMLRMGAPNQPMSGSDFMVEQNMCAMPDQMSMSGDHLPGSEANCITPSPMMSQSNSAPHMSSGEWPKGSFTEERRRKSQSCGPTGITGHNMSTSVPISHASPLSQPPSVLNSPSPIVSQSPGSRIPPPPYNQGIRPHSSPHPSSPATAGSLALPSPRTHSPATASVPQSTSRAQTPNSGSVAVISRAPTPVAGSGSVTQPSPQTHSPAVSAIALGSPRTKSPAAASASMASPASSSPNEVSRQSRVTHTTTTSPSPDSNSNVSTGAGQSPKQSLASTSSVQSSRTLTTSTVTTMKATTPSTTAPSNSSPSISKKVPNLMPPKAMGTECGSEFLLNPMSHSGIDQKPGPNEFGPLRQTLPNNCSSPFVCKPEPALMPVPSPQQIQYLNAFEGQELTIQKQPNISLRDTDIISPAPDLDLGFGPEFSNNCQPFGANFQVMDGVNPRFGSSLNGNQFGSNPRFMSPESNQRFAGPVFDSSRLPNPDNQFRPQNVCLPYNQMDSNMMRFNGPCDSRVRAGPPSEMAPRFGPPGDQFGPHIRTKSPMNSDQLNPNMMSFPMNQCFNQQMDASVSSTHLQNLQKMTPPFDMSPGQGPGLGPGQANGVLPHNHPHPHNANPQLLQGSNGSMSGLPPNQRNNFDPISSMAAMSDANANSPMPGHNPMPMQMTANGPPPGPTTMVNFHTNLSSMQGMHQNMNSESNGMQSPFSMNAQMNPQMGSGPQTVNNTYVNATMSIQQLNIQNMSGPNFNANQPMPMDQAMQPMSGSGMSSPSMQMMANASPKVNSGFGPHISGQSAPNFGSQQMHNPRPMNANMNFNGNPNHPNAHMGQRCAVYNSANIQIKPDAPNTIQYLPPRQQNPSMSTRPPSLDFLQRCEPPLTNLGNKLPTHNLQYFPSGNANMSPNMPLNSRMMTQNMAQNMPMGSGPGRPSNPAMIRGPNHGHGHSHNHNANPSPNSPMVAGQQPMPCGMAGPDMFGRPPGPPNAMFAAMKPPNAGTISPGTMGGDAGQPLPPSLTHSYNYKQNSINSMNALSVPSDPNYAIQYQHFQQQLYATNTTRGSAANAPNGPNGANGTRLTTHNFYNASK